MSRRKIMIVGAGQAGLQLAITLVRNGVEVTLVTDRTPIEIICGAPMSTQCMFDSALRLERAHDLDLWTAHAPHIRGLRMSVMDNGHQAITWEGELTAPAQSVDQRVKFPAWMRLFERDGGTIRIGGLGVTDLDRLTSGSDYDLVVIASGKGELGALFHRDPTHSPYTTPQRTLSVVYAHGITETESNAVHFTLVPEVGEVFMIPALTHTGRCHILFTEGVPGGPFETLQGIRCDATGRLNAMRELMAVFAPQEAERCNAATVTDPRAHLAGSYTPIVADPVGRLPSGRLVLGLADAVVRNDPIIGQGSNTAAAAAADYATAILHRTTDGGAFDEEWMRATFTHHWNRLAAGVTRWANAMLAPPPPHVLRLFQLAVDNQALADRFANHFNTPADPRWFLDPHHLPQ